MGPLPPGLGQRPFPSPRADAETPGFPRLPGAAGAPCSPPGWVPLGRGKAGRGGGAGPLLGSQAPAPGTIKTPSRSPPPGGPGLSAGWDGGGPGRVPLCPLSGGSVCPGPAPASAAPALLPPVGMMQQQCRRDGGRAAARSPSLLSAPGSFVSPHPALGRQLPKLVPTVQWGPGLWALFLNPVVGVSGLWGSWRDFRAGPEGGKVILKRTSKGSAHSPRASHWALPTPPAAPAHGGWKWPFDCRLLWVLLLQRSGRLISGEDRVG